MSCVWCVRCVRRSPDCASAQPLRRSAASPLSTEEGAPLTGFAEERARRFHSERRRPCQDIIDDAAVVELCLGLRALRRRRVPTGWWWW